MRPIYIETAGHSASKTVSEIFSNLPNSYVTHGKRNFDEPEPKIIHVSDQTMDQFCKSMNEKKKKYKKVVALHARFPYTMSQHCEQHDINFFHMIRNPIDQIDSCYNHHCKLIATSKGATKNYKSMLPLIINLNIRPTFANLVFFYCMYYVTKANISALLNKKQNLIKVEEILSSKKKFINTFSLDTGTRLNIRYFDQEKFFLNKHTQDAKKFNFSKPDKKIIVQNFTIKINDKPYSFEEYTNDLGYSFSDVFQSKRLGTIL